MFLPVDRSNTCFIVRSWSNCLVIFIAPSPCRCQIFSKKLSGKRHTLFSTYHS